jgi:hypothetical protein
VAAISVEATFSATPEVVWEELRHIERHVHWMHDAVRIDFFTEQREGVGTQFLCDTKVGPLVTRDLMTITEWTQNAVMGVTHRGLVTGEGHFTLTRVGESTKLTWRESLHFPWWLGGPIGTRLASPVLRALWTKNLRRLGARLASS